jgi:predicted enzyme related to lactoylglutathione lyase
MTSRRRGRLVFRTREGERIVSERDGYQPGVPAWIEAWESDLDAASEFYSRLFGWEAADGGRFTLRGRDVAGVAQGSPVGWTVHVWVDDAAETARRVVEAGGELVDGPSGGTVVFRDPGGALLAAREPAGHAGARVVNEPSAWSWAHLFTRDGEGARAFYGEVFGWATEPFGPATMFRLPGFVGGEPQQPVPRDVVAGMEEMTGDGFPPEAPPQWRVDFWVDDVDAKVARANELGGRTLVPAFDTPINRQAVLVDPQGAVFSVSRITLPSG